jgi:SAM-dependent methyltransferase
VLVAREGSNVPPDLPYFEEIIDRLESDPDARITQAFSRNVHWGYFANPDLVDDSVESFLIAAEELNRRICDVGGVGDGLRILDVGCGFGGAVDYLNHRLSGCEVVGLNIDGRQLERAREFVKPKNGNEITFIEGDACDLPLDGGTFDVVLAIECIFHFRSRKLFLQEAKRVLEPGGMLALSDFVLNPATLPAFASWAKANESSLRSFFGSTSAITPTAYRRRAPACGLDLIVDEDITLNTMPTYQFLRRAFRASGLSDRERPSSFLEALTREGLLEYHIMGFRSLE